MTTILEVESDWYELKWKLLMPLMVYVYRWPWHVQVVASVALALPTVLHSKDPAAAVGRVRRRDAARLLRELRPAARPSPSSRRARGNEPRRWCSISVQCCTLHRAKSVYFTHTSTYTDQTITVQGKYAT